MIICKIDDNGFYIKGADQIIGDGDQITDGYVGKQPMTNNGIGCFTGMYIPQWSGSMWIETATNEQKDAIGNGPE
ncbi:MAG: hypothetical protein ACE3JK_01480 [Sporolactobacillus sp.]